MVSTFSSLLVTLPTVTLCVLGSMPYLSECCPIGSCNNDFTFRKINDDIYKKKKKRYNSSKKYNQTKKGITISIK